MSEPGRAAALLHAPIAACEVDQPPVPEDRSPGARRRRRALAALVTAFVAYHTITLVLHVLPNGGLAGQFFKQADRILRINQYMRASSNVQSWSMFAPNPHRTNTFVRAFIVDQSGQRWDMGIDRMGRRSYPYLVYDRMAKINRRLSEQTHYIEPVAAWLCREWERRSGGVPALRVEFVKLVSALPAPESVYSAPPAIRLSWTELGFDPLRLPVKESALDAIECAETREAQLPPALRERYGLPPAPADHYLPTLIDTWWTDARAADPIGPVGAGADDEAAGGGQ